MTGTGELWVRSDGLPLRQIIRADFPAQTDYSVHAEFTVNFSDYANLAQAQSPFAGILSQVRALTANFGDISASNALLQLALLAVVFAMSALFVKFLGSKRVYAVVVTFVIVSMLAGPLLQIQQVSAYAQQTVSDASAKQAADSKQNAVQDTINALQDSNKFDPNISPLVTAKNNVGRGGVMPPSVGAPNAADSGGLTPPLQPQNKIGDQSNLASPTLPCADTSDNDNDGLQACDEALMNTLPNVADTDNDGLNEGKEVTGFSFGGKMWYSDPTKPSTLDDGIPDG